MSGPAGSHISSTATTKPANRMRSKSKMEERALIVAKTLAARRPALPIKSRPLPTKSNSPQWDGFDLEGQIPPLRIRRSRTPPPAGRADASGLSPTSRSAHLRRTRDRPGRGAELRPRNSDRFPEAFGRATGMFIPPFGSAHAGVFLVGLQV